MVSSILIYLDFQDKILKPTQVWIVKHLQVLPSFNKNTFFRWTFPRKEELFVPIRTARTTKCSRWLNTRSPKNPSRHKVVDDMIVSSKVSVVSPSPFWERRWGQNSYCFALQLFKYTTFSRLKQPKSWCCVWNVWNANGKIKFPSSVPSILNWEVTKNAKVKWFSSKCLHFVARSHENTKCYAHKSDHTVQYATHVSCIQY